MAQEIRLSSELEGPLQFLAGLYYEDVQSDSTLIAPWHGTTGVNPYADNPIPGVWFANYTETSYQQQAVFGELYYQLAEEWELSMGARHFDYDREDNSNNYSFDEDGSPLFRLVDASKKDQTYKVGINYTPSDNTLLFAQWSEGFRLGKGQAEPPSDVCDLDNNGEIDGAPGAQITDEIKPDTTENFELGAKLGLLDNRLQINVAVYRINWTDIPLVVSGGLDQTPRTCFGSVTANAGEARSQGFEIETTYQLNQGLRINFGGAYTNAEMTAVLPTVPFSKGDRLPSSPEVSVNLGLEYDFKLGGYASYMRGDYAYVSDFFAAAGETGGDIGLGPVAAGDYGQLNISAGIDLDKFNIELFAHNLANSDGLTHVQVFAGRGQAYRLRPRTIGLNVSYQF